MVSVDARRGDRLINANPYGNGTGDLHAVGRGGAQVPERDRRGPGRHQRADSGAGALLQVHRLAPIVFGDQDPYGKQVVQFYTQVKTVTARWFDDSSTVGSNMTIKLQ